MVCDCEAAQVRTYARYYDSPEGCDIPTKAMVAARYGIVTGLLFGTYDVMMYSHAVKLGSVLKRYFIHVVPLGAMGATFAVVSNYLAKTREERDGLNYFLGGLACGPLFGMYVGSRHFYLLGGLMLGMAGLVKKTALDYNYTFFPDFPSHMGMGVNSHKRDFSILADPKDISIATCGIPKPLFEPPEC